MLVARKQNASECEVAFEWYCTLRNVPHKQGANEITTEGNRLLWRICVIISEKFQGDILREIHIPESQWNFRYESHSSQLCPKHDPHLEDMVNSVYPVKL